MTGGYLADTHIVLWSWHEPERLSPRQLDILSFDAVVFVSIASVWEIAIKVSLGKLQTVNNVPAALESAQFRVLPISLAHAESVARLPLLHRDPFDRMLIAQAQVEGLTILTADRNFAGYDVALA